MQRKIDSTKKMRFLIKRIKSFLFCFLLGGILLGQPLFSQENNGKPKDGALLELERFQNRLKKVIQKASLAYLALEGGSGVIVSPEGEVFTNYHVVKSRKIGEKWYITDPKGKIHLIEFLSYDSWGDLAYLRLHSKGPHPFLPLAKPFQVKWGEPLVALGNPFSFSKEGKPFASLGIASAVYTREYNYPLAIQTDAALNPGNSGGPLVNLQGELVGINGKIAPRFGMGIGTGAGYAIPALVIRHFWKVMKKRKGEVFHGTIQGISLYSNMKKPVIASLQENSLAYQVGLRSGDHILAINGKDLAYREFFWNLLLTYPEGETVVLKIKRGSQIREFKIKLERFSSSQPVLAGPPAKPRLGIGVALQGKDLVIQKVVEGSLAHGYGLMVGDLILSVDGKKFVTPQSLGRYIRTLKAGHVVEFLIRRKNRIFRIGIPLKN
ncbi:MAG: PDZ domain-containing protein [Planctomycetota bacterium]|nr:MAG: PDZ domain-containing protein [Planctomycetota bacterium]